MQMLVVLTVDVIESNDLVQASGMVIGGIAQSVVHVHLPCSQRELQAYECKAAKETSYLSPF
jgi:hypothetical protein